MTKQEILSDLGIHQDLINESVYEGIIIAMGVYGNHVANEVAKELG